MNSLEPHPDQVTAGRIAIEAIHLGRGLWKDKAITGRELDAYIIEYIEYVGGQSALHGYKPPFSDDTYEFATCLAINKGVVHCVPRDEKIPEDALLTIDLVVKYGDWHADCARTYYNQSSWWSKEARRTNDFLQKCYAIHNAALELVRPNLPIHEYGKAVSLCARLQGLHVVKEFCGHGIGKDIHELPQVLNYHQRSPDVFEAGRAYALEPVLAAGRYTLRQEPDDPWSFYADVLTAHIENTIFVTPKCIINLTKD